MSRRVEALDWLRGIMALSIMIYHLVFWIVHPLDSSSVLGRFGVYGVSIFFIVSGLSMAIAYSHFIENWTTSLAFIVRRIFRIWPLLWVCVFLALLPQMRHGNYAPPALIFMNLTTAFGFISPKSYINTGAWSIGNEMVYYMFAPIIIITYNKSLRLGNAFLFIAFCVCMFFAFFMLDSAVPLDGQWPIYIDPLNNLFLFTAGIAIFYNIPYGKKNAKSAASPILLLASLSLFYFYPASGNEIVIVTGVTRIIFVCASIGIVVSFYTFSYSDYIPEIIKYSLGRLGMATYGVYLLHPIAEKYIAFILNGLGYFSDTMLFGLVIVSSIFFALVSYNLFEKKFVLVGKNITRSALQHYTAYYRPRDR